MDRLSAQRAPDRMRPGACFPVRISAVPGLRPVFPRTCLIMDWQGGGAVTVVYLDSVFVLNGVMDYFLLLAAAHLAGVPLRRGRFAMGALR